MHKLILHGSRARVTVILGLVVLGIVPVLFRTQLLMLIGHFLIVQDTLHSADVIHVIAGDDYRTDYAIQLYKLGYAKKLFFTGGWCDIHDYWHGEHAKERALAQGVPSDAIAFDDSKVTSTYMEAEKLKAWIGQSRYLFRSIIVVSDPFHMRRARWAYQKILGNNVEVMMAPVPFERTPYQRIWWQDQESRQNVREEYFKLVYYLFRYQLLWGFLKDWLASFDTN